MFVTPLIIDDNRWTCETNTFLDPGHGVASIPRIPTDWYLFGCDKSKSNNMRITSIPIVYKCAISRRCSFMDAEAKSKINRQTHWDCQYLVSNKLEHIVQLTWINELI